MAFNLIRSTYELEMFIYINMGRKGWYFCIYIWEDEREIIWALSPANLVKHGRQERERFLLSRQVDVLLSFIVIAAACRQKSRVVIAALDIFINSGDDVLQGKMLRKKRITGDNSNVSRAIWEQIADKSRQGFSLAPELRSTDCETSSPRNRKRTELLLLVPSKDPPPSQPLRAALS